MNFEQAIIKIIKDEHPDASISDSGLQAMMGAIETEITNLTKVILACREHKTLMPDDIERGLYLYRNGWGKKYYE